jgi:hypothetical protein
VLGEGRSGLAVRMAAMRLMHLGCRVHVVGETTTPALNDGDVLIAVSGPGGTPGVAMTAEQAKVAGGRIVAVTTTASSPLAVIAELVIPTPRRANTIATLKVRRSSPGPCSNRLHGVRRPSREREHRPGVTAHDTGVAVLPRPSHSLAIPSPDG